MLQGRSHMSTLSKGLGNRLCAVHRGIDPRGTHAILVLPSTQVTHSSDKRDWGTPQPSHTASIGIDTAYNDHGHAPYRPSLSLD
jgi:hypothetical protein